MKAFKMVRSLVIGLVVTQIITWVAPVVLADDLTKPTVLITGSNRGIGFELARQYAQRGWGIIATCRTPEQADALQNLALEYSNLVIERIDVTDFDSINTVAEKYRGVPIDVLINNAGILGDNDKQKFGTFDFSAFDEVMAVNTKGPIRMVEVFVDHVAASDMKKIMNISSAVASIQMTFGGQVFYRASKAALNMSMRTLAKELRHSDNPEYKALIFGLIDPGVVDTGFAKNVPIPMIQADESAAAVIQVIDSYDRKTSASFLRYTGQKMPW
ncbi:MAG: SDR family oxidoreductase [Gammaproteobacteria bacterium]|jgi:NAD(P)-dependent dehydrogenase (short-subunit alcohol dehydrogenase family)|nr:SDR family oxidoreductase [Gammaproteobacteria bacterium]